MDAADNIRCDCESKWSVGFSEINPDGNLIRLFSTSFSPSSLLLRKLLFEVFNHVHTFQVGATFAVCHSALLTAL